MYTYIILNIVFIGLMIFVFKLRFPRPRRLMLRPLAVLLSLTLVFDNLMIWLNIFTYNPLHILGLRLGLAPLEDFAYPLLAFLLIPSLYARFASKQEQQHDAR